MPRDFWYLWQGQLVSQMGAQAFQVLALFWLAKHTHQAGAGALFLTLSLLPPVLLGPVLTRWTARLAPRRVMMVCDACASLAVAPVLVAISSQASVVAIEVLLFVSNTVLALIHALMLPTVHAAVPALVSDAKLQVANGWLQTTQQLASVVGQALGGVAFALIGPAGLCIANMVGYAASGLFTSRIRTPSTSEPPAHAGPRPAPWALLWSNAPLRRLTIVSAVFNVLYAPWLVLLPFHLSVAGAPDAATMGLVLACYGVGSLIGNLELTKWFGRLGLLSLWRALALLALALILLGQTHGAVQTAVVLLLMGAGIGFVNVQIMTQLQLSVEPAVRAGAIAVMRSSVYIATPLGYGIVALAQHSAVMAPGGVYSACGLTLLGALLLLRRLLR